MRRHGADTLTDPRRPRRSAQFILVALIATFSAGTLPPAAAQTSQASLQWRVENPFRLFRDPADTDKFRKFFLTLSDAEKPRPVLSAERGLAAPTTHGWSESVYRSTCWSSSQLRYECASDTPYVTPLSHHVIVQIHSPDDLSGECMWRLFPQAAASRSTTQIAQPCRSSLTIEIPYPLGARVVVARNGREFASTTIVVRDLFIVGMGDSYASGDGNPDRPVRFNDHQSLAYKSGPGRRLVGYPARQGQWNSINSVRFAEAAAGWLDVPCRRSLYGHQLRAALQLAVEDPHRAITFATFACWGAQIVDGLFLPQRSSGLQPGLSSRSQLADVAALQCGPHKTHIKQWSRAF